MNGESQGNLNFTWKRRKSIEVSMEMAGLVKVLFVGIFLKALKYILT